MEGLAYGLTALTTTWAPLAAVAGVAWGIVGGALPGVAPSAAIALLIPFTYGMEPVAAITLLAATYVGAEYGGSIPAILLGIPGTNAAAATVADGHEMSRQGRAGEALGVSLLSGVLGGLAGLAFLALFTEPLADVALSFSPPAYFALGVLGLSAVAAFSSAGAVAAGIAALIGLLISTIGTDPVSGAPRYTLGAPELLGGAPVALVLIGLFAVSELMVQAGAARGPGPAPPLAAIRLPDRAMRRRIRLPQAIGSAIGVVEGCLPGVGGSAAAFMAYAAARRVIGAATPFGRGAPEGVAAPETANNAVACAALAPALSFGIPGSNSSAVLIGALLIHGVAPGPLMVEQQPEFVWSLFAGLLVANAALLPLGVLLVGPAIWLVGRPRPHVLGLTAALVAAGVLSIHGGIFELAVVLVSGVVGYALRICGVPLAPLVLGLVLGHLVESNFRRSLLISGGDPVVFLSDPLASVMLIAAASVVAVSLAGRIGG